MGSSLRHTKSEENLTGVEQSSTSTQSNTSNAAVKQSVTPTAVRQTPSKGVSYPLRSYDIAFNFPDDDASDCWSQEDDEITQQVFIPIQFNLYNKQTNKNL